MVFLKFNSRFYIFFLFNIIFISSLNAQSSSIIGKVTDASDNSPLWGTNIIVMGTSLGTTTDAEGRYRLTGIKPGHAIIIFRYIGYRTDSVKVEILSGKTIKIDVKLESEIVEGKEIVVTAQLQGQQAAINQQLTSNTIVNVVSSDKLRELPDQNIAESLARLPSISLQREGGEGQKVVVRGLAPKFNSITVNGEKVPSTDPEDRSIDLSMISPDALAGVEVYKSLTPDMDADAVGGTVNLVLKRASSGFQGEAVIQPGYNNHEKDYGVYKGIARVSQRFFDDKLGIIASGNIQRANRSSDYLDADYEFMREKTGSEERAVYQINNLNLADRKEIRDRIGGSVVIDYDWRNHSFMFSSFAAKTDRNELRRRKRYQVGSSYIGYELRDEKNSTLLWTNNLSGSHKFDFMEADWRTSYSISENNTPFSNTYTFREEGAYKSDLIDDKGPTFIPSGAKNTLSETYFKEIDLDSSLVKDADFTFQIDAKIPFNFSNNISGFIKLGSKYRAKNRNRDNTRFWTSHFGIDELGKMIYADPSVFYRSFELDRQRRVLINNFIDPSWHAENFQNGQYDFGPGLDLRSLNDFKNYFRNFTLADKSSFFVLDPIVVLDSYEAKEKVAADYVMSQFNIGSNLMMLLGVRYEKTMTSYFGRLGRLTAAKEQDISRLKDSTGTRSYEEILPMFQTMYKFGTWMNVRAAVTRTLSRPNYFELVPWERIKITEKTIERGRADLKHTKVWNYDLFFSFYNNWGLLTAGVFYKELYDVDFLRVSRITEKGLLFGYTLTQPENAAGLSFVKGFELDLQANLSFLPKPFDGIVIGANYSRMNSKTFFPFLIVKPNPNPPFNVMYVDTMRENRMPGQADYIGNFVIGYDKGGFNGRVSIRFQGSSLSKVGRRPEEDGYVDASFRVDIAVQQKITDIIRIYLNFNNITNETDASYFGIQRFTERNEYYGWTADFGVRIKF